MKEFIGLPLNNVLKVLKQQNVAFEIEENNFILKGDTTLVTNVKSLNNKIVLTVGEFIFNLKKD